MATVLAGIAAKTLTGNGKTKRTDQMNPDNLLPYDGHAVLYTRFLDTDACTYYLQELQQHIAWKQEAIKIFGKEIMQPRLTAWYGDTGKAYSYSGITMQPLPWTAALAGLKTAIETHTGYSFNSALLNLYRNGNDSMGWHRDNEKELGPEPVIASLSLGAARLFQFRHYRNPKAIVPVVLEPGSLLLMTGATQTHWQHRLPKTKTTESIRINITFRNITGPQRL
jgi:alkylated DNA repair dioxygenase AlkB